MRKITLPSGETIPILGQGTWTMGENSTHREEEITALRLGIDLGMTLIDTAEMYADGGAEKIVGEAIAARRDDVFLVSKVMPQNATRRGTIDACEQSLRRLKTDRIDLYLLHWRGHIPLQETVDGFDALALTGKIRYWGVSNFDASEMEEVMNIAPGVATNQVLYNLKRRGIEYDLLPWCERHRIPVMAYSPIDQGRLVRNATLKSIASDHAVTPAQMALAWVLRGQGVMAIPKMGTSAHVQQNLDALDITFLPEEIAALDRAFPPPAGPQVLEVI